MPYIPIFSFPDKFDTLLRSGNLSENDFVQLLHNYELKDDLLLGIARQGFINLGYPRRQYYDILPDTWNKKFGNKVFVMEHPYVHEIIPGEHADLIRRFVDDHSFTTDYCDFLRWALPVLCALDHKTALAVQEYDRQKRLNIWH